MATLTEPRPRPWRRRALWSAVALIVYGLVAVAPVPLDPRARTVAGVALVGLVLWVGEVLPLYVTGIALSILLVVVAGLSPGTVFGAYFDPVVVLLFGGFALGRALERHRLDRTFAAFVLAFVGRRAAIVLLGVMTLAAVVSMWVNNTATTAVVLPVAMGIVAANGLVVGRSNFARAAAIGVAYAATIGGIATPVGSTPNPLALRFLEDAGIRVSFLQWIVLLLPLAVVLLVGAWLILLWRFPLEVRELAPPSAEEHAARPTSAQLGVMGVFAVTVLLWTTTSVHGIDPGVVSAFAVVALYAFGLLDESDFSRLGWGTLILIGSSVALGEAIRAARLDAEVARAITGALAGQGLALVVLVVFAASLAITMLMNNTTAAVVMIPLVASLAADLGASVRPFVLVTMVGVSLDFLLPVGTPPNAMATATGAASVRDLLRAGIPLALFAVVVTTLFAVFVWNRV